jgi:prophage DNA circulation protein
MIKADALEAAPIVQRMAQQLAAVIPTFGRPGADARTALGDLYAQAYLLLRSDQVAAALNNAFIMVRDAGASYPQIEQVRQSIAAEQPQTLGATLIVNAGIELCLATQVEIVVSMTFVSRSDVDAMKAALDGPFESAIEIAADDMDQATFQSLTALYGAVTNHLVATARPLPQMLTYQFGQPMTALNIAYRLYADASRADEVRAENKIVHPAFCPVVGRALSA